MAVNQAAVHALTGGVSVTESDRAAEGALAAPSLEALGVQLHRLGDSFAHRKMGNEFFLYETGFGHGSELNEGTSPDTIQRRPELYDEYVRALASTLAQRQGMADPETFSASVAAELAPIASRSAGNTDSWYKIRLAENVPLESSAEVDLRGMIARWGANQGEGAAISKALRYRPEALDASRKTMSHALHDYLQSQGIPEAPRGLRGQDAGRAFQYAYELYERQRPK